LPGADFAQATGPDVALAALNQQKEDSD